MERKPMAEAHKYRWTCEYLGNWTGENFIQDFTCTWFPKHGKGPAKKLWPNMDPEKGCKFWKKRK
jgi:hypothetical protein